ncbi:stress responsive A/B Barrel domain-containing protein [Emericellopsis cladophorae]|uniref:Stress responsive A/B Barrel domain-containing protein n=1 Tax=Emericellopsis cladophorae TaxID=2686198 RepID=A0A9P9Y818_9HYPO|nr:stress responsive A/B Barrel domain-containing protein [Emericellopsis cladophorae]KAI6784695.1 stress responsive A/B Barrel domain-containing protein [Emericellopsis cladophorae]
MAVIHIVLFKFKPSISEEHRDSFARELEALRELPCVLNRQLYVGGPSVTDPIEKSKGFQMALVSVHQDLAALATYQASKEHQWVTSTWLWPFKEDVTRFDFEVDQEDVAGLVAEKMASPNADIERSRD